MKSTNGPSATSGDTGPAGRGAEPSGGDGVAGGLVERDGRQWYRIDRLDLMDPFLTTVVSDDDLWLFISSTGTLTAGRVDADGAVLPYETDDRMHRAAGRTGPVTVIAREVDGVRQVWRPYAGPASAGCTRAMERDTDGAEIVLEETNHDWDATFRTTWSPSPAYGWVRGVELVAGTEALDVEVLDGLVDVVPAGVTARTNQLTSNLVDSYKRTERAPTARATVHTLESLVTDRAEPAEALAATLVWSTGLPGAAVHLDERVVDDTVRGRATDARLRLTGRRGCHLLRGRVSVAAGTSAGWQLVVDTALGQAAVLARLDLATADDAEERVAADVAAGRDRLGALLDAADGDQGTGDAVADAHHRSNVMFNVMRGGLFPHGHDVPTGDLAAFVATRNRDVAERHASFLAGLPADMPVGDVVAAAEEVGDPDLLRLVLEHLPLTFSRRHGDPSRPWNRFAIRVRDEAGEPLLSYEGNWRDIFQNWEALLRSYPAYHQHVVTTFVDASTVDGHNPYRISRDGIDWEVPGEDEWSNIGYWGDHQLVYLHRLLRGWRSVDPAGPVDWLGRRLFTYADVPYRLAAHDEMVRTPRDTVSYDEEAAAASAARAEAVGGDGRLVVDPDGELVRVTLAEKLVVPALAKLSSLVPGAGIWMNTQRPEWNDANNALAGYGVSVVTLVHLADYLDEVVDLLAASEDDGLALSAPVAAWLEELTAVLDDHAPAAGHDDRARRALMDALGAAATRYRAAVAGTFDPTPVEVGRGAVRRLADAADGHLRVAMESARRPDGLYDGYDLLGLDDDGAASIERLAPMLEGQVAFVGSRRVGDDEALAVLDEMWRSPLYRADQDTFTLYPSDVPPPFLARNTIPAERAAEHPVLAGLVGPGRSGVLHRDDAGDLHFRPGLRNEGALDEALDGYALSADERAEVRALYEELFDHHAFTGRSGGMYGYEGIGSIYWHMNSKLLVALQERYERALRRGADATTVARLAAAYRRVRGGLGFRKTPDDFGAVPTDCYSHTPAHAGAQQPGMTGQVKEHVLVRRAELGVTVDEGVLGLLDTPLTPAELVGAGDDRRGWWQSVCGTPVEVVLGDERRVRVEFADGTVAERDGDRLTREESSALLDRSGAVARVVLTTDQWRDA